MPPRFHMLIINILITNITTMDLLQSQVKESCSLALPEGLKDLICDISREVLRNQPQNIPQFIADYLQVLLEVREKLSIAYRICNDTCKNICDHELYDELKAIGFSEEDIEVAIKILAEHLGDKNVKEQSLLIKLAKKISIDETQLPSLRDAIREAFNRHHIKDGVLSGSANKHTVSDALRHTLDWYKQNRSTEEMFIAPKFTPCMSTVSSTLDLDNDPGSYPKLLRNEKEYASYDYTLDPVSTGKVKFVNEKGIFNSSKDEIGTSVGNAYVCDDNIDYEDNNDFIAEDKSGINEEEDLTDNCIDEDIRSPSHDDSFSTVDEDFSAV